MRLNVDTLLLIAVVIEIVNLNGQFVRCISSPILTKQNTTCFRNLHSAHSLYYTTCDPSKRQSSFRNGGNPQLYIRISIWTC